MDLNNAQTTAMLSRELSLAGAKTLEAFLKFFDGRIEQGKYNALATVIGEMRKYGYDFNILVDSTTVERIQNILRVNYGIDSVFADNAGYSRGVPQSFMGLKISDESINRIAFKVALQDYKRGHSELIPDSAILKDPNFETMVAQKVKFFEDIYKKALDGDRTEFDKEMEYFLNMALRTEGLEESHILSKEDFEDYLTLEKATDNMKTVCSIDGTEGLVFNSEFEKNEFLNILSNAYGNRYYGVSVDSENSLKLYVYVASGNNDIKQVKEVEEAYNKVCHFSPALKNIQTEVLEDLKNTEPGSARTFLDSKYYAKWEINEKGQDECVIYKVGFDKEDKTYDYVRIGNIDEPEVQFDILSDIFVEFRNEGYQLEKDNGFYEDKLSTDFAQSLKAKQVDLNDFNKSEHLIEHLQIQRGYDIPKVEYAYFSDISQEIHNNDVVGKVLKAAGFEELINDKEIGGNKLNEAFKILFIDNEKREGVFEILSQKTPLECADYFYNKVSELKNFESKL